jgi:hypothetical protein
MDYSNMNIKSKSKFLKIVSGEPQDVRLLDAEPKEVYEHANGKQAPIDCGGAMCDSCMAGVEKRQKFVTNVYNHTANMVQVFKFGASIAKQIKNIANTLKEEGVSIMDKDLKLEAQGEGMSKKYTVTPRMTSKPVPEGIALF